MSTKSVHKKCPQKVSTKSHHKKCPNQVSTTSVIKCPQIVHKKYPQKVSTKSVHKKCSQKVFTKSHSLPIVGKQKSIQIFIELIMPPAGLPNKGLRKKLYVK